MSRAKTIEVKTKENTTESWYTLKTKLFYKLSGIIVYFVKSLEYFTGKIVLYLDSVDDRGKFAFLFSDSSKTLFSVNYQL